MSRGIVSLGIMAGIIGTMCMASCGSSDSGQQSNDTIVLNIQPLDGVHNVDKDVENFAKLYLNKIGIDCYKINILPHATSPDKVYNASHSRFRAEKLIHYLHDNTPQGEFTIGITDRDISTSVHGKDDFGILGLAYLGHRYRGCITSTYRLKHRRDLWKLISHEFTHGFFNQNHCKADNEECIMKDAKGKSPKLETKSHLCDTCAKEIAAKVATL